MEVQNETNKENKTKTNFTKRKIIIAALVVAGVLIGWEIGIRAYFYYIRPYFSGMAYRNYVDAYIQLQLNDKIGGDTPEQTVDLFIEALKKGDYDLASKYFVIDEQERWKKSFENPNEENINGWIKELENNKNSWHKEVQADDKVEFWYDIKEGEASKDINLIKNLNNKWKISSF